MESILTSFVVGNCDGLWGIFGYDDDGQEWQYVRLFADHEIAQIHADSSQDGDFIIERSNWDKI